MSGKRTKGSVFDAIEDDAGVAEQLKIKSVLLDCLISYIQDNELTQQEVAERMGVQRSRVGDVCRGHISVFSIDALVTARITKISNAQKIAVVQRQRLHL